MTDKLTTWSYSRWATYSQCPRKAKYLYIDKLPEEESKALVEGSKAHKEMENFIKYDIEVPERALKFKDKLEELKVGRAIKAEEMWCLNAALTPVGPWDADAWLRAKVDAYYVEHDSLTIIDWKTGKLRDKNMEQLELYALCAFKMFPPLSPDGGKYIVQLWYLDAGVILEEKYSVEEMPRIEKKWRAFVEPYFNDTRFDPSPSALCGWCSFSKKKGGPCEY